MMANERTYTESEMKSAEKLLADAKKTAAKIDEEIKKCEKEIEKYKPEANKSGWGFANSVIREDKRQIEKLKAQKAVADQEVKNKRG